MFWLIGGRDIEPGSDQHETLSVCDAIGYRRVGGQDGNGDCAGKRLGKSASLQSQQVPQILRALEDSKELPSVVQALHLTASHTLRPPWLAASSFAGSCKVSDRAVGATPRLRSDALLSRSFERRHARRENRRRRGSQATEGQNRPAP